MKANKKKRASFPAESKYLVKVRNFVIKYGKKMGMSPKQVREVKLAVDEAVSNIIRHAYVGEKGNFQIEILKNENACEILIKDQGIEFDWNSVIEPDLYRYVETRRKGGLGIWLIKKLIDEVEYNRVDGTNILTMRVFIEPTKSEGFIQDIRNRFSIRMRFAVYAVGFVTLLIVISYNVGSKYQVKSIRKKFYARYKSVAAQIANASIDLLLKGNDLDLENIAISVKNSEPSVGYVVIVNSKDEVLAHTVVRNLFKRYTRPPGVKPLKAKDSATLYVYRGKGGKLYNDFSAPVTINNSKIGEVHLGIPDDKFAEVTNLVNQRMSIVFIALFFWSTTIIGIFALGSTFIVPFRKLADEIARISISGQVRELRLSTKNPEVSRIGEAFNEIMRNLRITQGQLTDQTRLRRELQLAQEIQNALLPKDVPKLEGFEIDAAYRAALEVGGDYYDFFEVNSSSIGIVVADVSGKGIGSSMVMTMIRTSMRLEARGNKRASDVLFKVHKVAVGDIKKGMYVTMFYVILDSKKRLVNYASAGHNPMILYRDDTKSISFLNPSGIAVGIDLGDPEEFKKRITSEKLRLKKGDLLFLYTDGITEAMNDMREQFGEMRLVEFIKKYHHLQATNFKQKLNDEITAFTKGYPQSDDITFVVIKLEMSLADIEYSKQLPLFQMLDEGKKVEEALEKTGISYEEYLELKEKREKFGDDGLKVATKGEEEEIKLTHATHEQVKAIAQIVRKHPVYGVSRITKLLQSEEYGGHDIKESVVRRELIRMKLDTREKREYFAKRKLSTWASYK